MGTDYMLVRRERAASATEMPAYCRTVETRPTELSRLVQYCTPIVQSDLFPFAVMLPCIAFKPIIQSLDSPLHVSHVSRELYCPFYL